MSSDPIVDEIHAIREQMAARFNYDIDAIVKDAQLRDATDDRKVVCLPPRRPEGWQEPVAEPTIQK